MSDLPEANLQLKKRARRRLVGAVAFAGLAAVVLPVVMDEEPAQQTQDVQILIPDQDDQTPFNPAPTPADTVPASADDAGGVPPAPSVEPPAPVEPPVARPADEPDERPPETPKLVEKPKPKPTETPKPAVKPAAEKPKPSETAKPKPAETQTDEQLVAAIFGDKSATAVPFVIRIGAFARPENVRILQTKIGELGIKVYTEPLESPDGSKKTRVRAGPFTSRAEAERALVKMKRIGVNGEIGPL